MPEYVKVNSVALVDGLLDAINYPFSPDHYSSAVWADDANFVLGHVHINGHVVIAEIRHRYPEKSITGVKVAAIEINQVLSTCSIFAALSALDSLMPEEFVRRIANEIMALGDPVMMEGEELITSCCLL
jgi:hypothetical protein